MNTDELWPDADAAWSRVLKIQTKLHQWATDDPHRRFDDLYNLVHDPAVLVHAWDRVRGNRGARSVGVDGQTVFYISVMRGVEEFLGELRVELKARTFQPMPVRERMIPKPGGKRRRLGIATVRDRVVQAALKTVLEPIFEADFRPCSYGFRPGRRAHDAIAEIHYLASRSYEWALEGDCQGPRVPARRRTGEPRAGGHENRAVAATRSAHIQSSGTTPFPVVACWRRTLSPVVTQT